MISSAHVHKARSDSARAEREYDAAIALLENSVDRQGQVRNARLLAGAAKERAMFHFDLRVARAYDSLTYARERLFPLFQATSAEDLRRDCIWVIILRAFYLSLMDNRDLALGEARTVHDLLLQEGDPNVVNKWSEIANGLMPDIWRAALSQRDGQR